MRTDRHALLGLEPSRLCVAFFVMWAAQGAVGGELFFRDGHTDWKICLFPQAGPTETFAAEELRDALEKISGVEKVTIR